MSRPPLRFFRYIPLMGVALAIVLAGISRFSHADTDDAVGYIKGVPTDPVAQLQKGVESGKVKLQYDDQFGYLPSLLKAMGIPTDSQGLVFSKTSFQRTLISPHNPRAIYFNDDAYVGYVPGGPVLEIASMDKNLGTVFYTLVQRDSAKPKFTRQTYECTQCHQSGSTHNYPGLLMRSVYPGFDGEPILTAGTFVSDDTSPLKERWGGWYVTGKVGNQTHMGNATCGEENADKTDFAPTSNITDLSKFTDMSPHLEPGSDAVALMVLAHQTHLHNLMTTANYEVRAAIAESDAMNQALHQPSGERSDGTKHRIESACEPVVRAMLFCGEAKLADPIVGSSDFARQFSARGPFDSHGRSLRQLDLTHRMFKYPCSYLIYSEQFDCLPEAAKSHIYRRLWQVLTGREDEHVFDCLSDSDRDAIFQILRETKKDLPAYWQPHTTSAR